MKETLRLITSRYYRLLISNSKIYVRSHKSFETELVFTIANKGGTIEFHVYDESNKEILSLVNPESGTYNVSLETGKKYLIHILSKSAHGSYKIQKKILKQ